MKNSGCHCNQTKKTFKNLLLPNHLLDSIIILQECSLEVYRISLNKNDPSKNIGFMGGSFSFYYAKE